MKKLLYSLASAGIVAAAAFAATGAFFSDEETSVGNTFQAGAVDLKVDSECHYFQNGQDVGCTYVGEDEQIVGFGNWTSTDLSEEKFFMFDDVKPGDYGENTISLTVEDNDAYACMYIENVQNNENTRIDPEIEAGDLTDDPQGGELAQNLHFTAWVDQGLIPGWQGKVEDIYEGDNVWQGPTAEPLLFSNQEGPASDVLDGKVYDLNGLGGLIGKQTNYLGVMWCAGDLNIVGDAITCDGSTMGNEAQTDSLTADLRFYVEQKRNNEEFECPAPRKLTFVRTYNSGQNETNQAADHPYIEYVIDGDTIHFIFHNPTPFFFAFDYIVDGQSGSPGPYAGIQIHEGELNGDYIGDDHNLVSVGPNSQVAVDVSGTTSIWAGLRQGAEQSWYLDWIQFEAQWL